MDPIEESAYLAHLNLVRKDGYRPCMIAVLICNGKVGLCEAKRYHWYEFLQGGIEPGELPEITLEREIKEEAGEKFYQECFSQDVNISHMFDVQHKMKVKDKQELETGEKIGFKGKEYMVFAVNFKNLSQLPQINANDEQTEFKHCHWVDYESAKNLIKYTKSDVKREIAFRAVNLLKKMEVIK